MYLKIIDEESSNFLIKKLPLIKKKGILSAYRYT